MPVYTSADGDLHVPWSEVPADSPLRGFAPIGVYWPGRKAKDGSAHVAKGCPLAEWLPVEARVKSDDGSYQWATIDADTGPIRKSRHFTMPDGCYSAAIR